MIMIAAAGKVGRIVAFRLAPGEDLLEGLAEACAKHNLNNGLIMTGIGSLRSARFFNPVPLPGRKIGYGYGDPIVLAGPIELISANGMICKGDSGETLFHIHCGFSDQNGGGWGGHLIEGNKVLITADFIIGEVEDMIMGRRFNDDVELMIFHPQPKT
jgi:predicted DNA-binding protein with PD1-like motif